MSRNPFIVPSGGTVSPRCDKCEYRKAFVFADQRWKCVNPKCDVDRNG